MKHRGTRAHRINLLRIQVAEEFLDNLDRKFGERREDCERRNRLHLLMCVGTAHGMYCEEYESQDCAQQGADEGGAAMLDGR